MAKLDEDGDGHVSYEEFRVGLAEFYDGEESGEEGEDESSAMEGT